jgi:hypothetical protein
MMRTSLRPLFTRNLEKAFGVLAVKAFGVRAAEMEESLMARDDSMSASRLTL